MNIAITGLAFSILLAAICLTGCATDTIYRERYEALQSSGGAGDVDTYSPTEVVVGRHAGFISVAPLEKRTIPEAALGRALEYAQRNHSSSLLIWHKGRLQAARYWGGDATTAVNSRSLHKMLGGLLVGAAIRDGHIRSLDDSVADYITEWKGTQKKRSRFVTCCKCRVA
jgi:CubicO group peptidase (beta-lactamase class C family)